MEAYLTLLRDLRAISPERPDRTGVGVSSQFGRQLRFDLGQGFPLLTTKRLHFHSIIHELLWFLRGDTHIGYLQANKVRIWDEWVKEDGTLGPIYGAQWRSWPSMDGGAIDQISETIRLLKEDPYSRRMLVSAWNVSMLKDMALTPCHCLFQFYVDNTARLSCHLYQRSADVFLGLPFNIASYALLLSMMAQVTGHKPGELVISFGDVHLYKNHRDQADIQLQRTPRTLPQLVLSPAVKDIFAFRAEDIEIQSYNPHPSIKAPVAV